MNVKVAKFGGTSLADAAQFEKVIALIRSDPEVHFVVPSAPGKRHADDEKVTDLLLNCFRMTQQGEGTAGIFAYICSRFDDLIQQMGLTLDLTQEYETIARKMRGSATGDYLASRGEYLCGRVLAAALEWEFVDPAQVIFFDARGRFDPDQTHEKLSGRLKKAGRAVVPGFFGSMPDGRIKTFPRGGSDITGAIVARAVGATVYENWTDVSGFMMADPRIVPQALVIDTISYHELRELSYMGANVLHEDSIFPVRQAGIPIHIRNTNRPQDRGTMIVNQVPREQRRTVTGIAGRKGYAVINVDKELMNSELGFGRRVLSVLEEHGISFEHMPTGIDTLSVVVEEQALEGKEESVLAGIRRSVDPDRVDVSRGLALIATVGEGMVQSPGTAARLFTGLAQAGVNVRMIDQGSSEMNIIVGVAQQDFEKAVRAIYRVFEAR